MADEHTHEHEHKPEHPQEGVQPAQPPDQAAGELDAAGKSLSDALRISFAILKVIMVVLVVGFLVSGFKTVGSDERALVLRFGKVRGVGEEAVLPPGAHWVFPYPIDELIRIPVEKNISLAVNTFWYKETREDIMGEGAKPRRFVPEKLDPLTEGYGLTGSQRPARRWAGAATPVGPTEGGGSDYNIVHTRWQVNYQIASVEQFFRNVHVADVEPGQVYFDVMTRSITPMLRSVIEDAVVDVLVRYSIDEAIQSTDTIRRHVMRLAQDKLDQIESGVRVTSVQLVDAVWPKQVDQAFQAYFEASQSSQEAISQARTDADKTLTNTAGRVAELLYQALMNDKSTTPDDLWAQAAGHVRDTIAQAELYRTKVVETARANASYLQSILPEYRKRPELVAREAYLAAIQEVMRHATEKFILDKSNDAKEQEIRIMITPEPASKQEAQAL